MAMKILAACDRCVRPEMLGSIRALEKYGCSVELFDNKNLVTNDQLSEIMLRTEQNGPEAVDAGTEFIEEAKEADMILTHLTPVNDAVIRTASKLKLVGVTRGGCDNINIRLLKEKNIPVVNAPWRSAYAVADYTIGMILAETKNIAKSHHEMMNGRWIKDFPNSPYYKDMRNRRIGIIGFGYIGQLVVRELEGFQCEIMVHDPFLPEDRLKEKRVRASSLEELLRSCDVVSLHLRYSEKTKGFIGEKELSMMKPSATLINTARAGLIDQEALVTALRERKIMGAALDVYSEEPLPAIHPYRELDNITLTPHLAGVSNDTFQNGIEIVAEDFENYLKGMELKNRV